MRRSIVTLLCLLPATPALAAGYGASATRAYRSVTAGPRSTMTLEIGLGKGKKQFDKRETVKKRDIAKEMKRYLK